MSQGQDRRPFILPPSLLKQAPVPQREITCCFLEKRDSQQPIWKATNLNVIAIFEVNVSSYVCLYACLIFVSVEDSVFFVGDVSREDRDISVPLPLTTPAVRKMAKELGLDLHQVKGSGPGGRILKEDLMKDIHIEVASEVVFIKEISADPYSNPDLVQEYPSVPSVHREGERRTVPLRGLQRLMARSMTESLKVPQLCYSDDINCDLLLLLREGMKSSMKKGKAAALPNNSSPSILPLIIKATSLALKKHPIMNCSVHCAECSEIVYNEDHNIGE